MRQPPYKILTTCAAQELFLTLTQTDLLTLLQILSCICPLERHKINLIPLLDSKSPYVILLKEIMMTQVTFYQGYNKPNYLSPPAPFSGRAGLHESI